ncbi:MAG: response regulator [Chloroflexi bacterium]|nr:response regulator [Chloroflexota bacterium]
MATLILIVDDNKITRNIVSSAFVSDGYELFIAENGKEALEIASRVQLNLAILDIGLPDIDGYQICKTMRSDPRLANIPIIMLTGYTDIDNRLKAFAAGADDYIMKPFQMEELRARVKVHLLRAASSPPHPKTKARTHRIAVFSLRGGIGVSTLAVNLAVGLAQLWEPPTLLADLAFVNGQDALMLDVKLRNTWADLGKIPPEEIDSELIERVALRHASGVDVLAAPRRSEESELIKERHVRRVIELAATQYKYLVMDLPHDFSPTTLAALEMADVILLLCAPDLASVRCASNALNLFKDLGYPDEKIQLILNWNISANGLARKEIEKVLQKSLTVVIPHLPDSLVMAITMGKPIILDVEKPEAALLEDLSYFWSKKEDKNIEPVAPTPAWQRVSERAKRRQQEQNKS